MKLIGAVVLVALMGWFFWFLFTGSPNKAADKCDHEYGAGGDNF